MNLFLKEEANRCLLCKKPRCKESCPISTPIPEIIELYREERFNEAGKILFENNPLSAICAIVCPHEDQCSGNCIRDIELIGRLGVAAAIHDGLKHPPLLKGSFRSG